MRNLNAILKDHYSFFIGYLLFLLAGILLILFFTKAEGFYFLNPYHHNYLNYFFYFFTFLGDGVFVVGLAIILLFFKKRKLSLLIVSSYLLSGGIAQAIKYYFEEARPSVYNGLQGYQYFIENVSLQNFHSFPSGHTASGFALAGILAFAFKNKKSELIFLALAIIVGYSRIYIGQHFLIDVLAGSFIGIASAIICWLALYKKLWLV